MKEQGYDYQNPGEPMFSFRRRAGSWEKGSVLAQESDVAVAAVQCEGEARAIATSVALVRSYEELVLAENAAAFEEFVQWSREALQTAADVIESTPRPSNWREGEGL